MTLNNKSEDSGTGRSLEEVEEEEKENLMAPCPKRRK